MADERIVKGLDKLQRFLDQLPVKLEKNIMRGALRAGARITLLEAKGRIHSVSGELAASLRVATRYRRGRVTASVLAGGVMSRSASRTFGSSNFKGNKAIWVEYGTRPHLISVQESEKPINARLSAKAGHIVRASMSTVNRTVLKIGNRFVGPTVDHPGAKARPFMRPALDATVVQATIAAAEYIKSRLTKEGLDVSDVTIEQA